MRTLYIEPFRMAFQEAGALGVMSPFYERVVDEYKAELYIKGWANIRKKNHLLRFIPVSYTHLDVYKRQEQHIAATNQLIGSRPVEDGTGVHHSRHPESDTCREVGLNPVSYTHLDVYKRQMLCWKSTSIRSYFPVLCMTPLIPRSQSTETVGYLE